MFKCTDITKAFPIVGEGYYRHGNFEFWMKESDDALTWIKL